MDLYTSTLHDMWFTFYDLNVTTYRELLPAIVQIQKNIESDNKASFIAIASGDVWHMALMYGEWSAGTPAPFKPLEKLAPIQNEFFIPGTNGTLFQFNEFISPPDPVI